jgi:hypothetical protein
LQLEVATGVRRKDVVMKKENSEVSETSMTDFTILREANSGQW